MWKYLWRGRGDLELFKNKVANYTFKGYNLELLSLATYIKNIRVQAKQTKQNEPKYPERQENINY